jgi:hypothetical protein
MLATQNDGNEIVKVIGRVSGKPHEIKERLATQSGNRLVAVKYGASYGVANSALGDRPHRPEPLDGGEIDLAYLLRDDRDGRGRGSIRVAFCSGFIRDDRTGTGWSISGRQQWDVAVIDARHLTSVRELN